LRSVEAIEPLQRKLGIPIVTSNRRHTGTGRVQKLFDGIVTRPGRGIA
jgi:hypothetical protein